MAATLCEMPVDLDDLFYQSVVDEEFRMELLHDADLRLPVSVEAQDQTLLEVGMEDMDIYACATSCSWGPFTVVCDGTTK